MYVCMYVCTYADMYVCIMYIHNCTNASGIHESEHLMKAIIFLANKVSNRPIERHLACGRAMDAQLIFET